VSLFAELKRRNVFRVGLFYVVTAWLVIEVAETVLPLFDVPTACCADWWCCW
jgi:adenylate cyclase